MILIALATRSCFATCVFQDGYFNKASNRPPRYAPSSLSNWAFDAAQFGNYAERDQTRREHVLEIQTARPFTRALYRELAAWLLPTALVTDHGPALVTALLEELRARRIVCPPLPAIERLGGSVRARAQRQLWRRLTDGLTDQRRQSTRSTA